MVVVGRQTARILKGNSVRIGGVTLYHGDALGLYGGWPEPVVIVSDGPYGLEPWDGGVLAGRTLAEWYEPHIAAWAAAATALTTLWFWNTEVGWAEVHSVLLRHGWLYRQLCVWDKGLTHAANNANTKTLRKLPAVTEVCGHYVRPPQWVKAEAGADGASAQAWLRSEWDRTGLPLRKANEACGLKNMVSRRYLDPGPPLVPSARRGGGQAGRVRQPPRRPGRASVFRRWRGEAGIGRRLGAVLPGSQRGLGAAKSQVLL